MGTFGFHSARQKGVPEFAKEPDQHGCNAADQVSNKLGAMVGADSCRLMFAACRVCFLGKLVNYLEELL
jgi:hypothetical protein